MNGHTFRKRVHVSRMNLKQIRTQKGLESRTEFDRDFLSSKYVMDKDHVAKYKTYGCKAFEHKNQRKWLRKRQKYENHQKRKKLRKELAEIVKSL